MLFLNLNGVLKLTCQFRTSPTRFQSSHRNFLSIKLWPFLYITALSISRITIVSLEYFESFFPLMCLFRKDFQRNVQHSIQMRDITKPKRIRMLISFSEILVTRDVIDSKRDPITNCTVSCRQVVQIHDLYIFRCGIFILAFKCLSRV